MAKKQKTASELLSEYKKLQEEFAEKEKKALRSKTYTSSGFVDPTDIDIDRSKELRALAAKKKSILSDYQRIRWYGTEEDQKKKEELYDKMTAEEKRAESTFSKVLHWASTPLYAGVGVAETALGKGSEEGLWENIQANVKERETYGDLIAKYGYDNWATRPLGFTLDIALDPLNWATMGTGALVPRIAKGAYMGVRTGEGLYTGLKAGVKSGFGQKAAKISKHVPILKKEKETDKLARWASDQTDWYNKITKNTDILKQLPTTRMVQALGRKFEDMVPQGVKDTLWYSPTEKGREVMKLEDTLRDVPQLSGDIEETRAFIGESKLDPLDNLFDGKAEATQDLVSGEAIKSTEILGDIEGRFRAKNSRELADRMAEEASRDRQIARIVERVNEIAQEKTGIKILDETKTKIGRAIEANSPKVKKNLDKIADWYKAGITHFKIAKVALSPAAYTNAFLGNATMAKMAGIDLSPGFKKDVIQSMKMVWGGKVTPEYLKKFVTDPEVYDFIKKYPRTFTMAFGISTDFLKENQRLLKKITELKASGVTKTKLVNIVNQSKAEMKNLLAPYSAGKRAAATGPAIGLADNALTTTYSADVLAGMANIQQRMIKKLDAVEGSVAKQFAKMYKTFLTKPMNMYESVDQSYKLGMFTHLSTNGISRKEFDMIKKIVPIGKKDFERVADYDLYKMKPHKAVEISQEIFMNYGAMPGVVKVLRTLPIMGSPFASFAYAMAAKTGKTAFHNPAFFSKMNSLQAEISGGQDPVERKHLESIYNSYLNKPGMMRLPMFTDNPTYMRIEQLLPYYSLNIFQPSERKIDGDVDPYTKLGIEFLEKTGIGSDPVGQVLLNYFLLPLVLQEELPTGTFGQQLYPSDATTGQKWAYAGRDLTEAALPPVVGPLGTIQGFSTDQAAPMEGDSPLQYLASEEFYPSYRYRQFARAVRGQTSVGVESASEAAASRWLRTFGSWLGLPMYTTKIRMGDIQTQEEEKVEALKNR